MRLRHPLAALGALVVIAVLAWSFNARVVSRAEVPQGLPEPAIEPAAPNPPRDTLALVPSPVVATDPFPEPEADSAAPLPPGPPLPTSAPAPIPAGALLIPVAGVRASDLVDTYTAARSSGRSHDAIDIMAPRGTPVLATATGSVMKLFQSVQGGITLYQLAPDQRTVYYYAHLDRYAPGIVEGMELRQGDTLGYVGDTGNAGRGNYHLHFEVGTTDNQRQYWGTTPRNPYPLLVARPGPGRP